MTGGGGWVACEIGGGGVRDPEIGRGGGVRECETCRGRGGPKIFPVPPPHHLF